MSHFAQVKNGIVQQVIVAEQDFIDTLPDKEDWIQTSYNTKGNVHYDQNGQPDNIPPLRANYAGLGDIYDLENDVFYNPQPFPSWSLNKSTWVWESPTPYPQDDNIYYWDEQIKNWIDIKND